MSAFDSGALLAYLALLGLVLDLPAPTALADVSLCESGLILHSSREGRDSDDRQRPDCRSRSGANACVVDAGIHTVDGPTNRV